VVGLNLPNLAVFGGEDICKARRNNCSNPFAGQREVIFAIVLKGIIYNYISRKLQWNENNNFYHNVIAALVVNVVLDNDSKRLLLQKVIKVFDLQRPVESDDIGDGGEKDGIVPVFIRHFGAIQCLQHGIPAGVQSADLLRRASVAQ
jgi:hypothetical protein